MFLFFFLQSLFFTFVANIDTFIALLHLLHGNQYIYKNKHCLMLAMDACYDADVDADAAAM